MKRVLVVILCMCLLTGCKKKTYTVTFMDDDKVLSSIKIKQGDNINNSYIPKKDGYIFVNWLKDGIEYNSYNEVNTDITLTANWTKEPNMKKFYTVTFNYGNGDVKTQSVVSGEKAKRPDRDPKLDKHTFLGWYIGETLYDFEAPVDKDIVIQAKYQKNRVIVTYDLAGGSGTTQVEIGKGDIPAKPKDPVKFGYDFLNWTLDGLPYNFDFPLNEDATIKANYVATVYVKVTFDSQGGNTINSEMLPSGSTLSSLPVPVKSGYTFKYWSYLGNEFNINTKIDKDIILVAVYELEKTGD